MSTQKSLDEVEDRRRQINNRLTDDLDFFSEKARLVIKTKEGSIVPFKKNRVQLFIEENIRQQLSTRGFVRSLILKGRQQGCSTYIGARFYHKAIRTPGTNVFILSHQLDTTKLLFSMVKTFQENIDLRVKPETSHSNAKELIFPSLNSLYRVATAGSGEVGRGGTIRLFHGSEVAFWTNTEEIKKGALQQVPLAPGTEILLESTANGMGNMFYQMCMDAMKGKGLYNLIFIPWFWSEEYQLAPPSDFELTEEEQELIRTYPELTAAKLFWRRMKIQELSTDGRNGLFFFRQEYPNNPVEAFQSTGDALISAELINKARQSKYNDPYAPIVIGVDPSGTGKDRCAYVVRQGRTVLEFKTFEKIEPMELVGKLTLLFNHYKPDKVFIDYAHGYAVADRLKELGYKMVQHIHFGEGADDDEIYHNKRAEMWTRGLEWFKTECSIPDSDEFQADLQSMPVSPSSPREKIKFPPKDEIKRKLGRSPDLGDAFVLTFAKLINMRENRGDLNRPSTVKRMNGYQRERFGGKF